MKKLRCKKEFGIWFYEKENPNDYNDLDAPIYTLYDEQRNYICTFAYYNDMKYYLETGIII